MNIKKNIFKKDDTNILHKSSYINEEKDINSNSNNHRNPFSSSSSNYYNSSTTTSTSTSNNVFKRSFKEHSSENELETKKENLFIIENTDFPDLDLQLANININNNNIKNSKNITTLNFANAAKKEVVEEQINTLPKGWVEIFKDKDSGNILMNYSPPTKKRKIISYKDSIMCKHFELMINRWENYKNKFIELNGEDEYYETYGYSSIDEDIVEDSDNESNEYDSTNDEYLYEDNDDYY